MNQNQEEDEEGDGAGGVEAFIEGPHQSDDEEKDMTFLCDEGGAAENTELGEIGSEAKAENDNEAKKVEETSKKQKREELKLRRKEEDAKKVRELKEDMEKACEENFTLECVNCQNLNTNYVAVANRRAHVVMIQEHKVPEHEKAGMVKKMKEVGCDFQCSGVDEDTAKPNAGVGVVTKTKVTIVQTPLKSDDETIKKFESRIVRYEVNAGWEHSIAVYNIYGKAGRTPAAIAQTEEMLESVLHDNETRKGGPVLIMGDFNIEPEKLRTVRRIMEEAQWTDLGAEGDIWGRPRGVPTFQVRKEDSPTRIDAVLANPEALPLIEDFQVVADEMLPDHRVLKIKLGRRQMLRETEHMKTYRSLKAAFYEKVRKMAPEAKGKEKATLVKEQKMKLHGDMDRRLEAKRRTFEKALEGNDATKAWEVWSKGVEEIFLDYIDEEDKKSKMVRGRGVPTIIKTRPIVKLSSEDVLERVQDQNTKKATRLTRQARRCTQTAFRLGRMTEEDKKRDPDMWWKDWQLTHSKVKFSSHAFSMSSLSSLTFFASSSFLLSLSSSLFCFFDVSSTFFASLSFSAFASLPISPNSVFSAAPPSSQRKVMSFSSSSLWCGPSMNASTPPAPSPSSSSS